MGNAELKDGMSRMLTYRECILEDEEIKKMCNKCEAYLSEQHDYNECTECQGFKFYCELKEYRFYETFDKYGG